MVVVPRFSEWATCGSGILKGFCTLKLPGEASHLIFSESGFVELFEGAISCVLRDSSVTGVQTCALPISLRRQGHVRP